MADRLKSYLLNEEIPYRKRIFVIELLYVLMATLISVFTVIITGKLSEFIVILLPLVLFCIVLLLIHLYKDDAHYLMEIFCFAINIILLPLLFLFGGGMKGGVEFMFIPGIIAAFSLLSGPTRIVSMIFFGAWYCVIIIVGAYNPELLKNEPEGISMIISAVASFVLSFSLGILLTIYQNSVLKRQNKVLGQAMESCAVSTRTKSRFLANMSHELRTPMNAIIGMADYMKKADSDNEVADEISVVRSTAENLLKIVDDILIYSKIESEKLEMIYEQFYFNKMIGEVIQKAQDAALEKGTELEVELDPAMPYVFYGDDIKISRIFSTLLMSAVENTENGRVTMSITGRKNRDGNKVTIEGRITDTGEGLSKEDMETIYSGFETYDSKKGSRIKILGLELTVCRGILEMMNGSLSYESIKDVGSSAVFNFDCFIADSDSLVDVSGIGASRVLVVGGSEWERKVWGRRLNEFKTVVDTARDENEFVMETKRTDYSYLFIEMSMYDILKKYISEKMQDITYIICDNRQRFGDFGKCRVVRKPLTVMNLGEIFCDRWNEKESESADDVGNFVCRDTTALVVDDNRVNLKVAVNLLESYRIRVIPVDSGFAAISVVRKTRPDLILMDQVMPGIGGVETMQEIKYDKRQKDIPIVCMTADMDEDIKENLIENGFDDYLPKPIKDRQLERILLDHLPSNKIVYKGLNIKSSRLRYEN